MPGFLKTRPKAPGPLLTQYHSSLISSMISYVRIPLPTGYTLNTATNMLLGPSVATRDDTKKMPTYLRTASKVAMKPWPVRTRRNFERQVSNTSIIARVLVKTWEKSQCFTAETKGRINASKPSQRCQCICWKGSTCLVGELGQKVCLCETDLMTTPSSEVGRWGDLCESPLR